MAPSASRSAANDTGIVLVVELQHELDGPVDLGGEEVGAQGLEPLERQHDALTGITLVDDRHDRLADHLGRAPAAPAGQLDAVTDRHAEVGHRVAGHGDLLDADRGAARAHHERGRPAEAIDPDRLDLALAAGACHVELARTGQVGARHPRVISCLTHRPLERGVDARDGVVPRLAVPGRCVHHPVEVRVHDDRGHAEGDGETDGRQRRDDREALGAVPGVEGEAGARGGRGAQPEALDDRGDGAAPGRRR